MHLAICEGCQAYVEQFKATIEALGTVPVETPELACAEWRTPSGSSIGAVESTMPG